MRFSAWLAALLVSSVAALPAAAMTVAITYSGLISSGFDTSGFFGTARTDLTGAGFAVTYLVDTARVPVTHSQLVQGNSTISGGESTGTDDPIINATLTINGYSYVLNGSTYSEISSTSNEHYSSQYSRAIVSKGSSTGGENSYFFNTMFDGDARYPGSLEDPFSGP